MSQVSKLFKVAGVSKTESGYKVRFATDMTRVKALSKINTDVNLIELPEEMQKPAIVAFLKTTSLYENAEYREAIDTADVKYNSAKTVKVSKAKATVEPSLEAIRARAKKSEPEIAA